VIDLSAWRGETVAVFGLGASGLSACRALAAAGARVLAWDDREAAQAAADRTGARIAPFGGWNWGEIASLVLSPGVPLTHPRPHEVVLAAQAAGVEVIGDTEIFQRALDAARARHAGDPPRLVAITGTNGKSTTTKLTEHLLTGLGVEAVAIGNIGAPVLDAPDFEPGRVYVMEVSSYQLDLTPGLHADVAVLLNISPDHLDRHGSMEGYVASKRKVFANLARGDAAVVGVDDPWCEAACIEVTKRDTASVTPVAVGASISSGVFAVEGCVYERQDAKTTRIASLKGAASLRGAHNHQNAAAALAIVRGLGLDAALAARRLDVFKGLAHRSELVGRIGRVSFVNDSKATNPEAAAKALGAWPAIYWIAGGRAKSDDFSALDPVMGRVRRAYFIGEAAERMAAAFAKTPHQRCKTLSEAVSLAADDAAADEAGEPPVVLLSPACASFDQFENFEARGDAFRALVHVARKKAAAAGEKTDAENGEAA